MTDSSTSDFIRTALPQWAYAPSRNGPLRKRWFLPATFLVLGHFAGLTLSSATAATTETGTPSPPPQRAAPLAVQQSLAEVLDVLQNSHLLTGDEAVLRRAVIQAVLDALDCNGAISPPLPDGSVPSSTPEPAVGRTGTLEGKYGYVLILTLNSQLVQEMEGLIGEINSGHYEGLIVDLRYAGGDATDSATQATSTLHETKLPVVMLINRSTVGAAEILARQAREVCGALVVGQPTRGLPYARRRTVLRSGDVVLLPDMPAVDGGRAPLLPDLMVEDDLARETLLSPRPQSGQLPMKQDPCLRKAVDLLSTIRALQGRHF
ncbi:MAG: hypothetical protein A3K18_30520 [Lentisphaerae bacterium RIFOXYA12_64_32]|nr:MAG: hypothetical protein A3K18_30520 [Lentisphaerae bacterium RIFOXYA12_64_32]